MNSGAFEDIAHKNENGRLRRDSGKTAAVRLGDVFDLQMGKTPSRSNAGYWKNGSHNWVSIADLGNYQKYVGETKEKITDIAVETTGIKVVPSNTIIMSFKLSLGKAAITKGPVYTNEAIMAFIPTGKYYVLPDYFYYLFAGRDWSGDTRRAVMGTTLNKATLAAININLPPFDEQRRIAAVLDKISDLIAKRRRQLDKLDELVKSRFVKMFGNPDTNNLGWNIFPLGELFDAGSSKRVYQSELTHDGVPFLRISDLMQRIENGAEAAELYISEGHYEDLKKRGLVPSADDILITSRGTLGACYVMKQQDRFYFQDGMISWLSNRNPRVTVEYITHLFQIPSFRKQIDEAPVGSTVNYLSLDRLKKLRVICPPVELQEKFAVFIKRNDELKQKIQHSLAALETLKKSKMQEFFGIAG